MRLKGDQIKTFASASRQMLLIIIYFITLYVNNRHIFYYSYGKHLKQSLFLTFNCSRLARAHNGPQKFSKFDSCTVSSQRHVKHH